MEERITGMMVYYYFICKRKLWYFCNELNMEKENDDVIIGKILDENSYARAEKHINIDNTISIDFIKEKNELHEVKKSRAIEEAGIWQVKYYLYYLKKKGMDELKASIDYPLLKKKLDVILEESDISKLDEIIEDIIKIRSSDYPEELKKMKICEKCAYFDLCYI